MGSPPGSQGLSLPERFDVHALEADGSSLALIGPEGRIEWANSAWFDFAERNGGLYDDVRIGADYFEAMRGPPRLFYLRARNHCIASGEAFEHEYECSSPDEYRLFHVRMRPLGGGYVLVVHSIVARHLQERVAEAPDEALFRKANGVIAMCSNCRRFERADSREWAWVPEWIGRMPARVSHSACAVCAAFYEHPPGA